MDDAEPPTPGKLEATLKCLQGLVDKTTIWPKTRWCCLVALLCVYGLRIYLTHGFFIVTYGLGIYMLNLLIGFLSPAEDPDVEGSLPTRDSEEFRPFTRKLPEFKFWLAVIRATIACIFFTFFEVFDLPVFWPILLAYFVLLFSLTMKDRIKHMVKHKYIPFSFGKQTYGDLTKMDGAPAGGKDAK
mmetsp:Transcript_45551/g.117763  ORF Transcript_45551/g.117763 Transcript_45551/m.117763 type:complete len:186 (-) Transcript_45551:96-653(-)